MAKLGHIYCHVVVAQNQNYQRNWCMNNLFEVFESLALRWIKTGGPRALTVGGGGTEVRETHFFIFVLCTMNLTSGLIFRPKC